MEELRNFEEIEPGPEAAPKDSVIVPMSGLDGKSLDPVRTRKDRNRTSRKRRKPSRKLDLHESARKEPMPAVPARSSGRGQPAQPQIVKKQNPSGLASLFITLSRSVALLVLAGVVAFFIEQFVFSRVAPTGANQPANANVTPGVALLIPSGSPTKNSGTDDRTALSNTENTTSSKLGTNPASAPEVGQLTLKSDPAGLKVEVVNRAGEVTNGVTPMTLDEPPGNYMVRIVRPGWDTYAQHVDLEVNGNVTLAPAFPDDRVTLKSDPPGASIFLGETELGKTPLTVAVPLRPLELVSRNGMLEPVTQMVVPDQTGSMVVEFKHSYGYLTVNSDRPDAEVVFAGVNRGKPPFEAVVPPGPQQITVRAPGMPDQTRTADLKQGEHMLLQFNFASETKKTEPSASPSAGASIVGANEKAAKSSSSSSVNPHKAAHRHPQSGSVVKQKTNSKPAAAAGASCPEN